jgi:hypothetical protein
MGAACIQLSKMLDPGINKSLVQHSTTKTVTTALGALWELSAQSKDQTVMIKSMSKSCVTSDLVKSQWVCFRWEDIMPSVREP